MRSFAFASSGMIFSSSELILSNVSSAFEAPTGSVAGVAGSLGDSGGLSYPLRSTPRLPSSLLTSGVIFVLNRLYVPFAPKYLNPILLRASFLENISSLSSWSAPYRTRNVFAGFFGLVSFLDLMYVWTDSRNSQDAKSMIVFSTFLPFSRI